MKNYFKIGLMALTLAFGVTSCDKQDNGGAAVNALSLEAQGLASKVTFGEAGNGMAAPKGFNNLTGKNAGDFTHRYSSTPQALIITNSDGEAVYTGAYDANDITSINPASIILANANDYVATSSNLGDDDLGIVSAVLPYTSTIDFDLSESRSIVLAATLSRGFLIVNAEAEALGSDRVTAAEIVDGELRTSLLDGEDGDYYAYLEAGTYNIEVTYLLNEVSTVIPVSQVIVNGKAYTIDLGLTVEDPDPIVTSNTVTTTMESTEVLFGSSVNDDGDLYDTIVRDVYTTIVTTDGVPAEATVAHGEYSILLDHSEVTPGQSGTGTSTDTTVYDVREYSAYAPAFGTQIADFIQTRTVTNVDGNFNPAIAEESLSLSVTVSSTGGVESTENSDEATLGRSINSDEDTLDTITRQVTSDEVYTASVDGTHTVVTANGAWSIVLDNDAVVADTADSGAWVLNTDGDAAIWVVTQGGNALDATPPAPAAAPGADLLVAGKRYVDGDGFDDLSVAIELIPVVAALWVTNDQGTAGDNSDDVFTNSDYSGYSFIVSYVFAQGGYQAVITTPDGTVRTSIISVGATATNEAHEAGYDQGIVDGKAKVAELNL